MPLQKIFFQYLLLYSYFLLSNNVASYIIYNKQDKGAIQNDWRYAKMDT
jgi:hypothetical protein